MAGGRRRGCSCCLLSVVPLLAWLALHVIVTVDSALLDAVVPSKARGILTAAVLITDAIVVALSLLVMVAVEPRRDARRRR